MLELPELEQRLSNLQSQVERLWRKAETSVPPIEQRLAAMADQYAEYLKRWAATVERHTNAVAQLETYASEWKDASTRVRQETSERLHELESTIEREWDTLKQMQEEPIRELRQQAESLTQVSLAMAKTSQQGVDRAEARFTAFETEVHLRLNELTHELTSAISEMKVRLDRQAASRDPATQWSLDDVTKLHGQLRDGALSQYPHTIEHASVPGPRELPSAPAASDQQQPERVTIGGRPIPSGVEAPVPSSVEGPAADASPWDVAILRKPAAVIGLVALVVIVAGLFGWRLQGQIRAASDRAAIAEKKADVAVNDAARREEEARQEATRQTEDAREMATRLQRIGNVMSASDLIRFNLASANGASGQALFSRSRGVVISGSGLPSPPPNGSYQGWLLTRFAPIKMGPLVADSDGTFTLVQPVPSVPRVVGVMVTTEPAEVGDAPTGAAVLSSIVSAAQPAPEAQP